MAKIALTAALTAGAAAGGFMIGGPMGAVEGASIGLSVGSAIFLRPKIPGIAPLQDLQVSSSADGAPIPFGYGTMRFGGQFPPHWAVRRNAIHEGEKTANIAQTSPSPFIPINGFGAGFCAGFVFQPVRSNYSIFSSSHS